MGDKRDFAVAVLYFISLFALREQSCIFVVMSPVKNAHVRVKANECLLNFLPQVGVNSYKLTK
ncbi:MAG: hypothetical protein A2167_00035 [Planctomycetes bacterium RBG_13_46_10]|nr:MAG: hypothetical protein A2167_00035 [Planctomycetes bacterium RBG_13_46_10]